MKSSLLSLLAVAAMLATARAQNPADFQEVFKGKTEAESVYYSSPLVLADDGSFYGTSASFGINHTGSVYRFSPSGPIVSTLYSFGPYTSNDGKNADGVNPTLPLLLGHDGNLYGVTAGGGPHGAGVIFKLTSDGAYSRLYAFNAATGDNSSPNIGGGKPMGGVVQGGDGNFYGTTPRGGSNSQGTIYQLKPDGTFTTLKDFSSLDQDGHNADGTQPACTLVTGTDGNFYGTTPLGGSHGKGTAFRITPDGGFTTLHHFTVANAINQYRTVSGLTLGPDGNFYGSTDQSSVDNVGTIYRMTPDGVLTTIYGLTVKDERGSEPDGATINTPLTLASDGNFYGTTYAGGKHNVGTVFRVTPNGVFTVLYDLSLPLSISGVRQGVDGRMYGEYGPGGSRNFGHLFAITIAAPAVTSPAAATAEVGRAFSYRTAATQRPTSYRVPGLSPGLTFNTKTGLVSGTPTKAGTYHATIQATNSYGTVSAPLTVTVQPQGVPFLTSPATASAVRGQPFSYQITADYGPTRYGVLGLTPGLHVEAATGLISGTPTTNGAKTLTLRATNATGTGSATLALTIAPN